MVVRGTPAGHSPDGVAARVVAAIRRGAFYMSTDDAQRDQRMQQRYEGFVARTLSTDPMSKVVG
jgi:hypothetical protein